MAFVGVGGGRRNYGYARFAVLEGRSGWDRSTCLIRSSVNTGAQIIV